LLLLQLRSNPVRDLRRLFFAKILCFFPHRIVPSKLLVVRRRGCISDGINVAVSIVSRFVRVSKEDFLVGMVLYLTRLGFHHTPAASTRAPIFVSRNRILRAFFESGGADVCKFSRSGGHALGDHHIAAAKVTLFESKTMKYVRSLEPETPNQPAESSAQSRNDDVPSPGQNVFPAADRTAQPFPAFLSIQLRTIFEQAFLCH
jgi:hypothetical protein